jgi:plastocyanin
MEMVKFHIASFVLMNPRNILDKMNNNRTTKAVATIPIAGILVAAALLSGLSVIGSETVIAQQNMTATNVTAGNVTGANVTGANATNVTGTTGATGGGGAATTGVSIVPGSSSLTDTAYQPNPAQVSVGDTVTWTNDDTQPHTVTSGSNGVPDGKFDSSPNFNPLIAPAATFSHTFTEAGEYPYYCAVHPIMVGTVSVS